MRKRRFSRPFCLLKEEEEYEMWMYGYSQTEYVFKRLPGISFCKEFSWGTTEAERQAFIEETAKFVWEMVGEAPVPAAATSGGT